MVKSEPERRLISAWVPAAVASQFERTAQENERSVSAELRLAIREHLAFTAARERVPA
jgi:hypothetical protein